MGLAWTQISLFWVCCFCLLICFPLVPRYLAYLLAWFNNLYLFVGASKLLMFNVIADVTKLIATLKLISPMSCPCPCIFLFCFFLSSLFVSNWAFYMIHFLCFLSIPLVFYLWSGCSRVSNICSQSEPTFKQHWILLWVTWIPWNFYFISITMLFFCF